MIGLQCYRFKMKMRVHAHRLQWNHPEWSKCKGVDPWIPAPPQDKVLISTHVQGRLRLAKKDGHLQGFSAAVSITPVAVTRTMTSLWGLSTVTHLCGCARCPFLFGALLAKKKVEIEVFNWILEFTKANPRMTLSSLYPFNMFIYSMFGH